MSKVRVLVLYTLNKGTQRNTVLDHLYCFYNYVHDVDFHYCNILSSIPFYINLIKYDAVIIHYTLLSMRWEPEVWFFFVRGLKRLKKIHCTKIAIPQDEYAETEILCRFFKEYNIDTVYTCASTVDYETLYPKKKTGLVHYFSTIPGFVDENKMELIRKIECEDIQRDIDIGYRARSLPFWLGDFAMNKTKIAKAFNERKNSDLQLDISTDQKDVFLGDDWIRFLLSCKTMLGCLGGASLYDKDGSIRKAVEAYVMKNPNATFKEVENQCFKGKDYSLHLFALSPRHFECAMAKTCQILLEGDYKGVFVAGTHYIELKKDFSNIREVFEKVRDTDYCNKIVEKTFVDIVLSGKYTYRRFAQEVINHIRSQMTTRNESLKEPLDSLFFKTVSILLSARQYFFPLHFFTFRVKRFYCIRIPKALRLIKDKLLGK